MIERLQDLLHILISWDSALRTDGIRQATVRCAYWRLWWSYWCRVCSKQTWYKRRLRLLWWVKGEGGVVVCVTKGNGGMCRGMSWCCDEGSLFGILTPGWLSVAEEQLCCRFHIPGFWRQGRYYCILYEGKEKCKTNDWNQCVICNIKLVTTTRIIWEEMGSVLAW